MVEKEAKSRILSPALIGFFRRRLMELCGIFFVIAGLALTATLFSPGRYDPSFSAFSSGDIENWFGALGANIAGALRASFGSASFFLTLLPIGWGYRLVRKQIIGYRLARLFLSPVSLLLIGAYCARRLGQTYNRKWRTLLQAARSTWSEPLHQRL